MKLNNKGAASVIVILIVVVLATFGGIALTAGWTNKELSIKAAQSKADYYALDSLAEQMLAEVDNALYLSSQKTTGYLNALSTVEDLEFLKSQERLQSIYKENLSIIRSTALRTKKIYEAYNRIYFYESAKSLEQLAGRYGVEVNYAEGYLSAEDFISAEKIPEEGDLTLSFAVSEGENAGDKSLDVVIAVAAPYVETEFTQDGVWYVDFNIYPDEDSSRYEVYSWKLRQNPIDEEVEIPKFG